MCILTLALKNALPATNGPTKDGKRGRWKWLREAVTFLELGVDVRDDNGIRKVRTKPMILDCK